MRPRIESARELLASALRRTPGAKSAQLAERLAVSVPTVNRILAESAAQVLRVGRAGQTRYFARRALRGSVAALPLYAIDRQGQASQVATLALTAPQGSHLDLGAMGWPVEPEFKSGWWPGLPYPLHDMRPQGFLGRNFAHQQASGLGVSDNPNEWSDDDVVFVLSQQGADTSGNLVLGEVALQAWLESRRGTQHPLAPDQQLKAYAHLADVASAMGAAGSSAGGEFPKFTAVRELAGSQTPHVIVKFSGGDDSSTVRRWADLLVCEHLALESVQRLSGLQSASSRILQAGGRTFLELERFDRHGDFGRSPLCSLFVIDAAMMGQSSNDWGAMGALMHKQGWLGAEEVRLMRLAYLFGKLIGNTDMHKGNLSFQPGLPLRLAPVYDMLPMLYAPLAGGEVPLPAFAPKLPMPHDRDLWHEAAMAALAFWKSAAEDSRISADFREILRANRVKLEALQQLG